MRVAFTEHYINSLEVSKYIARFDVFAAVKIQVGALWFIAPCSVAVGYQGFGGPCCLHFQYHSNRPEDGGSKILRNFDILPQHYHVTAQKTST